MTDANHYHSPEDASYGKVYKKETPEILEAFGAFNSAVFAAEGRELDLKTRELIAIGVATATKCVYCIEAHATNAVKAGATDAEIAEAAWVSTAIQAGGGLTHGRLAFKFAEHAH
ncbi:carboxymuconolactone decarboxylase family protein [Sediminivirga luteola]|uniref:Carboxymuconolactone decarboxylase-like domain-containing protein n=1 Tax=Sediminivirga luteola TaxID=1774748 RepID=A0A8J2XK43_9MICO|nr:carboxymuconolactone decarboxylase family protein [Sediminivirga luteola]MCI2265319.1 carboxymuconolactone decarboxylase family protein [Sediminivirga luteola]GGA24878.1 hypothetical protein GCM10011333_29890 [Sediminivirga luteola]